MTTTHSPLFLAADSDPDTLGLYASIAAMARIDRVMSCRCGLEAFHRIRQYLPDVVFMDLKLPRLDGLSLLRRLDSLRIVPSVQIVVITGIPLTETMRAEVESLTSALFTPPAPMLPLLSILEQARRRALSRTIRVEDDSLPFDPSDVPEPGTLRRQPLFPLFSEGGEALLG